MGKASAAAMAISTGVKMASKYAPQAKVAWDKGGKKAAESAARRAKSMTARRRAVAHAATLVRGSILKVAPEGLTTYVVFTRDKPIASYPTSAVPFEELLAHADLTKRERPVVQAPQKSPDRASGKGK